MNIHFWRFAHYQALSCVLRCLVPLFMELQILFRSKSIEEFLNIIPSVGFGVDPSSFAAVTARLDWESESSLEKCKTLISEKKTQKTFQLLLVYLSLLLVFPLCTLFEFGLQRGSISSLSFMLPPLPVPCSKLPWPSEKPLLFVGVLELCKRWAISQSGEWKNEHWRNRWFEFWSSIWHIC